MGGVRPLVVVEGNPPANPGLCLRAGFPCVQIDAFILQGPPEAFDEYVVEAPPLAIHAVPGPDPFQPVSPGEGRELRSLIGVQDLTRAKAMDRLVQGFDAEVRFQRVRDARGQYLAGAPVHDGDQVEKASAHRQVRDVGAPDLVGPIDPQATQQIGVGLVPLCRFARVRLLIDRHQAHEPLQSTDVLLVGRMALVLQVPSHLPDTIERGFQELPIDQLHQRQVHLGLALRRVVERRLRDRQQAALRPTDSVR